MSTPFAAGLADVAAAFGAVVARALERAVLRDCADEAERPDAGRLRRSGRFAWFEASGPFFGNNRYAVERGEVSWLPTPVYRDELRGASALFARYTPLTESDASALIVVLDAFGDGKIAFVQDERARHVSRGVFAVDIREGESDDEEDNEEDDEFAPRGRILVELATGVVTVERPKSRDDPGALRAQSESADAAFLDDGLRAMLVSAHKRSRRAEHDLDDATNVDAHPPIAAQRAAQSSSDELDDVTATTDVDKARR